MLWAAWADALGFISELVDEPYFSRRLAGRDLDRPLEWRRRVGGRLGVEVDLPAGTYSDDTQMRLAVARAIRFTGFDVEAFAKVELPVWVSYALGGGRASKSAASNLANPATPWFGNFFKGWDQAGGNGVAMRIHPHVWASRNPLSGDFLGDLFADAVVTHGHPRAFVGAVFHAWTLAFCLEHSDVPAPEQWAALIARTRESSDYVYRHVEVADVWCKRWLTEFGSAWESSWHGTVDELEELLPAAASFVHDSSIGGPDVERYLQFAGQVGGVDRATRGSGTITAVMALALASAAKADPSGFIRVGAQALNTDTDTVASMAGAALGATLQAPPPTRVLDQDYLVSEAVRLANISDSQSTPYFRYPDLLHWVAPKSQSDAVGLRGDRHAIAGLGSFEAPLQLAGTRQDFGWSWGVTEFGQTLLVKHRSDLMPMADSQFAPFSAGNSEPLVGPNRGSPIDPAIPDNDRPVREKEESDLRTSSGPGVNVHPSSATYSGSPRPIDIDTLLGWLENRGYQDADVGRAVRRVCEAGDLGQLATFTTALSYRLRSGQVHANPADVERSRMRNPRISVADAWERVEKAFRRTLSEISAEESANLDEVSFKQLVHRAQGAGFPSSILASVEWLYRERSRALHEPNDAFAERYYRRARYTVSEMVGLRRPPRRLGSNGAPTLFDDQVSESD
jgi:ADP-ribosylglycohydrolase